MRARKVISRISILLFILFIAFCGYAVYKYVSEKPPIEEMNLARESIAKAKTEHAGRYASDRLAEAEKQFADAMREWNLQNEKFVVFRNFSAARELAVASLTISVSAKSEAGSVKTKYKNQLEADLQKVGAQIANFEKYYKNLPVGRINFDRYNKGKIEYLEALHDFKNNDFQKAMVQIAKSHEKLTQAENASRVKLENFFSDYPDWQKDEQLAFQLSRKGQTVVLVNKMEATCAVLKSGKAVKVFDAEFGPNWLGDKMMKGDRATPQGIYKVTEKKRGAKTKFHKALLLNYPNNADNARFSNLKKSGSIPRSAEIGGLIEIHGGGGKGVHWTDGCIALDNKEMDSIYDLCPTGAPVIVIGANISLNEYLNGVQ